MPPIPPSGRLPPGPNRCRTSCVLPINSQPPAAALPVPLLTSAAPAADAPVSVPFLQMPPTHGVSLSHVPQTDTCLDMLKEMVPQADIAHRPESECDLLLKAGHVIDSRNQINHVRDVAVQDGKIVAVAPDIPVAAARKVIDVSGLYVTPGLFDFHFHCYAGPADAETGDNMTVFPDPFTFPNGVTTVGEAGSSGWRTFPDFKRRVIDRVRTRILTFLHIAGGGSASGRVQDLTDMDAEATAELVVRNRDHIIGIKTADYEGPEWTPFERALEAATSSGVPWFCDFGALRPERPLAELMQQRLRPGDIYTHIYAAMRGETDGGGRPVPALWQGRQRGVLFDVGPGAEAFCFAARLSF